MLVFLRELRTFNEDLQAEERELWEHTWRTFRRRRSHRLKRRRSTLHDLNFFTKKKHRKVMGVCCPCLSNCSFLLGGGFMLVLGGKCQLVFFMTKESFWRCHWHVDILDSHLGFSVEFVWGRCSPGCIQWRVSWWVQGSSPRETRMGHHLENGGREELLWPKCCELRI